MISAIQEVPWLSFEPKVSKLPSARNWFVSSTFLTAESFNIFLIHFKNWKSLLFLLETLYLFYFKIVSPHSKHFQVWKCFFSLKKTSSNFARCFKNHSLVYLFKRLEPYLRILSNVGVGGCRRFGLVCRLRGIHHLRWRWRGWLLGGQIPSRGWR